MDEQALKELFDAIPEEYKTQLLASFTDEENEPQVTAEAIDAELDNLISILDSPEAIERINQIKENLQNEQTRQQAVEQFSDAISTGVETLRSLDDLRDARRQISESQADLNELEKPADLGEARQIKELPQEIRRRLQSISPTGISAQTEGLRSDIASNYARDINNAAVASGGQAGAFQSNAQLASQNRLRGAMTLQQMQDQIRSQRTGELDRAIGLKQADNQQADRMDIIRQGRQLDQYNTEAQQAGQALASGRLNRRFALGNLGRRLGQYAGRAMNYASMSPGTERPQKLSLMDLAKGSIEEPLLDFSDPASLMDYDPMNPSMYNTTQSQMRYTA